MPMLDIQRRHAEVFRLRLGEKRPDGKPRSLTDAIRVTSPNFDVVAAFAEVFGGTPRPWSGGEGQQHEVYLPISALPVMILPGESIQQWWELWKARNEAVCERRCDGFIETLSGEPCICSLKDHGSPEVRMKTPGACRPMTRLSVICPDVEVIGAGSLVTHGMIAAETLPQSVMVAQAALARGLMVPAIFRVIEHKGRKHYIVPQLEIVGVSLNELTTGEMAQAALSNGHKELAPPGPAALSSGGGTEAPKSDLGTAVGGQAAPETPPAASPPFQGGVDGDVPPASTTTGPRRPASKPPLKRSGANGNGPASTTTDADPDPNKMSAAQNRMIHALLKGLGVTDETKQRELLGELLNRELDSRGNLTVADATVVIDGLKAKQQERARA